MRKFQKGYVDQTLMENYASAVSLLFDQNCLVVFVETVELLGI